MFGRSVTLDWSFDHCNDIHGSHRPPYVRSQALLGMFVDQGQYPKRRAFLGLIMHKIPSSISGWLVRLSDALRSTFPAVWFGAASCVPASFLVVVLFALVWCLSWLLPAVAAL